MQGMLPAKTARTRSVGTKLSEEEYARLEALAAQRGLTVGEWVREVVLKAGEPQPASAAEPGKMAGRACTRQVPTVWARSSRARHGMESHRCIGSTYGI